jgi:hypothetical protein
MKFSQVAQAAQSVAQLKRLEDLIGGIDMDATKKAKVLATVAKLKTDFMDGTGIEPDAVA